MTDNRPDTTNNKGDESAVQPYGGRVTPDVLKALQRGDSAAFDIVYLTYKKNTLEFVSRLIGSREAAEDITQEIFIGIWEQHAQVDPKVGIKRNIFVRARSRAIDYLRRNNKFTSLPDGYEESKGSASVSPDQSLIEKEIQLLLDIALEAMPPQRREVYKMSAKGMTYDQIAHHLGITNENARKHLSRARKDLEILRGLVLFFLLLP